MDSQVISVGRNNSVVTFWFLHLFERNKPLKKKKQRKQLLLQKIFWLELQEELHNF
jgi:hypothetical protein